MSVALKLYKLRQEQERAALRAAEALPEVIRLIGRARAEIDDGLPSQAYRTLIEAEKLGLGESE